MNAEKMRVTINNLVNGNISDFITQVRRFKKYEIVDLILYIEEYYSNSIYPLEFKRKLRKYLKG